MGVLGLVGLMVMLLIAVALTVRLKNDGETSFSIRPAGLLAGIILLLGYLLGSASMVQVESGYRGVVLHFGAVTDTTLDPGLHFITPFADSVEPMDVQTHAYSAKASAASSDLQTVNTEVTVNYRLDPSAVGHIYQDLRREYETRIIAPAVQESVKANTAQLQAEKLITQRSVVKAGIDQSLRERLAVYGIIVETVNITDFAFSPEFEAAIEAKVTAQQKALQAQNDLTRIEIEAQQTVARAKAEAEAIRIRAEALKENPQLVQLEAVQKWDGKLPVTMLSNAMPFFAVNNDQNQTQP